MRPFTATGGAAEKATLGRKLNQRVWGETSDMDSVFYRGSKADTKASQGSVDIQYFKCVCKLIFPSAIKP